MKRLVNGTWVLICLSSPILLFSQDTIDSILKDLETEIALEQKPKSKGSTIKAAGDAEILGRDPLEVSLDSLSQEVFNIRREVDHLAKDVEEVNLQSRFETDQMGLIKIEVGFPSSNDKRLSSSVELKINGITVYELLDLKTIVNDEHRFVVLDTALPVGEYTFSLVVRQSSLNGETDPLPLTVSDKKVQIKSKNTVKLSANIAKGSKNIDWTNSF